MRRLVKAVPALLLIAVWPGRCRAAEPPAAAEPWEDSQQRLRAVNSCMGLGEPVDAHTCACEPGWAGPRCASLDLLPVRRDSPGWTNAERPNWGGSAVWESGGWYLFAGAKTDTSAGASDRFALNSGMMLLRSNGSAAGPYAPLGEIRGLSNQAFGFRADAKRHPIDGALLVLTEAYAHPHGFGFVFIRSASGSALGPWTEHLAYALGRDVEGGWDWTADPANADDGRFDCRLADPTFAVLPDGTTIIAYRGTPCCCDEHIGAWGSAGEHVFQTVALLRASSWEGPYARDGVKIFGESSDNEDVYLWTSARGVHALMHSQDNSHHLGAACDVESGEVGPPACELTAEQLALRCSCRLDWVGGEPSPVLKCVQ